MPLPPGLECAHGDRTALTRLASEATTRYGTRRGMVNGATGKPLAANVALTQLPLPLARRWFTCMYAAPIPKCGKGVPCSDNMTPSTVGCHHLSAAFSEGVGVLFGCSFGFITVAKRCSAHLTGVPRKPFHLCQGRRGPRRTDQPSGEFMCGQNTVSAGKAM